MKKLSKDFAVDVDVRGELRDTRRSSAYVYQRYEPHLPRPYPASKFVWAPRKDIARLPSVIASPITTGPTRTVSPQTLSVDEQYSTSKRSSSDFRGQYPNLSEMFTYRVADWGPYAKWARDKLGVLSGQRVPEMLGYLRARLRQKVLSFATA